MIRSLFVILAVLGFAGLVSRFPEKCQGWLIVAGLGAASLILMWSLWSNRR